MNLWCYFFVLGCFWVRTVKGEPLPCTTPNGEKATCVSLLWCPVLLDAASKDVVAKKFVEASVCQQGSLIVCCGTSGNFTERPSKTEKPPEESARDYAIRKLLPSKTFCGMQHTDDYFYNETETSVDEFPWLVYFPIPEDYVNNFYLKKESNCVGVLISNQYVLTTTQCLELAWPSGINHTIEMIFGQHHIYKDVSCIPTQLGIEDCSLPVVRGVTYEWYTTGRYPEGTNVTLLRLKQKIFYSDFVRPICLPLAENEMPVAGDTVLTSGWGEEQSVEGKSVKLKKRVKYTVMSKEECESGNPVLNPICGAPLEDNTHVVCPGDNGGPVMYKLGNNWLVSGIVAGVTNCDEVHPVTAELLTANTLDWIFDVMRYYENKAASND